MNVAKVYSDYIDKYKGYIGVQIAGIIKQDFQLDKDECLKVLMRVINTVSYPFGMRPIEFCKIIKDQSIKTIDINFKLNKMEITESEINKLSNMESYVRIIERLISMVFINHITIVAKSKIESNIQFTMELGWTDILEPVDKCENPKKYFEQKYIQDAISFSEKITNEAVSLAMNYVEKSGDDKNE